MHSKGLGIPQNSTKALEAFSKAADLGLPEAKEILNKVKNTNTLLYF